MGAGSVDNPHQAGLAKNWDALHHPLQIGHNRVKLRFKQLALGLPILKAAFLRPGVAGVAFVEANQSRVLLLPVVGGTVRITHNRQLFITVDKGLDRLGDDILVFHVDDGDVEAHPGPNPGGVAATRINHMFADDVPLLGDHFPFPVRQQIDARHPVVANNRRAHIPGSHGHSLATTGRVDIAVVQGPGPGHHTCGINEWIDFFDFLRANDLHAEADIGGDTLDQPEVIKFLRRGGQTNAAATMPARRLTRHLFQFLVERVAVLVNLGQIVIGNEAGALTGRMPG